MVVELSLNYPNSVVRSWWCSWLLIGGYWLEIISNKHQFIPICEPWCWNIYQCLPHKSPSFVGKYTSTMLRIWDLRQAPGPALGSFMASSSHLAAERGSWTPRISLVPTTAGRPSRDVRWNPEWAPPLPASIRAFAKDHNLLRQKKEKGKAMNHRFLAFLFAWILYQSIQLAMTNIVMASSKRQGGNG